MRLRGNEQHFRGTDTKKLFQCKKFNFRTIKLLKKYIAGSGAGSQSGALSRSGARAVLLKYGTRIRIRTKTIWLRNTDSILIFCEFRLLIQVPVRVLDTTLDTFLFYCTCCILNLFRINFLQVLPTNNAGPDPSGSVSFARIRIHIKCYGSGSGVVTMS